MKTNQTYVKSSGQRTSVSIGSVRKSVKKDTKNEILNGAINLFSKKGYTETSMREIAIEANIQPGSIYNHFKSKQEILDFILETYSMYIEEHSYSESCVENLKKNVSTDGILECMFLAFPDDDAERFRKMLFIILHEQHRIDAVRQFVIDKFIYKNLNYVKDMIDMLLENGLIEPVDSDAVAKLHVAILYFWSNVNLFGIDNENSFSHKNNMADALRFLFNETIKVKQ